MGFLVRKTLLILASLALLIVIGGGSIALIMAFKDRARFEHYRAELESKIESLQNRCDSMEEYLNDIESDSELLEHVARKRLGLYEKDELVFKFTQ